MMMTALWGAPVPFLFFSFSTTLLGKLTVSGALGLILFYLLIFLTSIGTGVSMVGNTSIVFLFLLFT